MKEESKELKRPTLEELEKEFKREERNQNSGKILKRIIGIIVVVVAATVIAATLFLPVLRIYGTSMMPTFEGGDIVLTVKTTDFQKKDIVAFYYNNKILIKRVIATEGEWVDIDEEGNVSVDGKKLEEPYVLNKEKGEFDMKFPYQVPENRLFVMGDNRSVSVDSRNSAIGSVAQEQIVGKLIFQVWPLNNFGKLS